MRKLLLKAVVGILSLWISGCEFFPFLNNRDSSTTNTPKASPTPNLEASESPSPKPADAVFPSSEDFPQKPETAIDLIRPTDPNQRIKSLKQRIPSDPNSPIIPNTKDPFSGLPTIPVPPVPLKTEGPITQLPQVSSQQVPDVPNLPETFGGPGEPITQLPQVSSQQAPDVPNLPETFGGPGEPITQLPQVSSQQVPDVPDIPETQSPSPGRTPGRSGVPSLPALPIKETPPGIPSAVSREPDFPSKPLDLPSSSTQEVPSLPELPIQPTPPTQWRGPGFPLPPPPPPDTTIADGIEVSGVVQVGSQKQIIVKVPTEVTSRYVKIGQSLANGKVLVKRVSLNKGAVPIVVFEQSGVEITKEVGSKPKTTDNQ